MRGAYPVTVGDGREALNGRALPGTGSGYLLVAHAPEDALERRDLYVHEGALRDSAGKLVTYPNGQMNTPASTEDRISALRRPILSASQPMA